MFKKIYRFFFPDKETCVHLWDIYNSHVDGEIRCMKCRASKPKKMKYVTQYE